MMLCLEGASAGLPWATILHKEEAYCVDFHDFKNDACAAMTDEELEAQRSGNLLILSAEPLQVWACRRSAQDST